MRDILIDGLPILDLLEVTMSTSNVASLANCDQSSVSRIYRHVSSSLELGFRKSNGTYRAHTNQELLASLRSASQLLRLQRGADHIQWVGSSWNGAALAELPDLTPLPRPWQGDERTLALLESRVLDLAVVDLAAVPSREALAAVPLAEYPAELRPVLAGDPQTTASSTCIDGVLVRREHLERPALQSLITQLQQAYRQAYGTIDGIRWP